jgi:hypothetical protein
MIMRRRLYFMLPDVSSARALLDELLLARIEERHMHFWAKDGSLPDDMPDASFLQKTDLVHGAESGMLVGGAIGLMGAALLMAFPPEGFNLTMVAILVAGIVGALFGAWSSGMVAAAIPNSRLKAFHAGIERGQVLLMIDVPHRRVREVEELVENRHPEIRFGGVEPHIPAFP